VRGRAVGHFWCATYFVKWLGRIHNTSEKRVEVRLNGTTFPQGEVSALQTSLLPAPDSPMIVPSFHCSSLRITIRIIQRALDDTHTQPTPIQPLSLFFLIFAFPMDNKHPPSTNKPASAPKPSYISSSGHVLESYVSSLFPPINMHPSLRLPFLAIPY
jgi:hypothetical protein